MCENFDYSIGDVPDKENLVGDIYFNHRHFAEITTEDLNNPIIDFYSPGEKENAPSWTSWPSWIYWGMPLDGSVETLKKVMERLKEIG